MLKKSPADAADTVCATRRQKTDHREKTSAVSADGICGICQKRPISQNASAAAIVYSDQVKARSAAAPAAGGARARAARRVVQAVLARIVCVRAAPQGTARAESSADGGLFRLGRVVAGVTAVATGAAGSTGAAGRFSAAAEEVGGKQIPDGAQERAAAGTAVHIVHRNPRVANSADAVLHCMQLAGGGVYRRFFSCRPPSQGLRGPNCGAGEKGAQRGSNVQKRRERKKREARSAKTVKRTERVRKIKAVRIEGMRLMDWGDRAVCADAKGQKRGRCVGNRGRKMEENLFGTYKMRANVQAIDKMREL